MHGSFVIYCRLVEQDDSEDEIDIDERQNLSRLLDPPPSFLQGEQGGMFSGRNTYSSEVNSAVKSSVTANTRAKYGVSDVISNTPRRRLSTSYTPLDATVSNGGAAIANTWSGMSSPVTRRQSSTERRRTTSGDHLTTPVLTRVKSVEPISAAEIMTVYHQHSVLYPDEVIPSSWACGCSLKEAADVSIKLEGLLIQAEKNRDISEYVIRIIDALRLIPGLFGTDSFHDRALSTQEYGESANARTVDDSIYESPERHIGTDLHGTLTPKGREELLSGRKICHLRSVQHRYL